MLVQYTPDTHSQLCLVLAVVSAPATAAVASTSVAAKAAVVSIAALLVLLLLLVASALLVAQSAKSAVLGVASKVSGIATEALLVRLLGKALRTLAGRTLCGGSRAALLGSQSRWAGATALGITEWLQRVLVGSWLTDLLLAIRALRVGLGATKHVGKTTKSGAGCSTVVLGSAGCGSAVVTKSTTKSAGTFMRRCAEASNVGRGRRVLVVGCLGRHSVMVRLAVHALSEAAVSLLLTVAAELVHVVSIVGAAVVWVVVRVAAGVSLGTLLLAVALVHLALGSRSRAMLSSQGGVGCVVTAVLSVVVATLALFVLVRIMQVGGL
jgi:hypothetical protein